MNRSRKAYLEALVELLRTKSYSKITASDIIRRSGYGRTGFYRQFSDKNALAAALVKEHTAMYARILANDLRDSQCNMEDMVRHILEHVMQHRAEYHAILSSQIPGHGFDEFCARSSIFALWRTLAPTAPMPSSTMTCSTMRPRASSRIICATGMLTDMSQLHHKWPSASQG